MNLITIEKLEKKYNANTSSEVHALRDVSLKIDKGDLISIIGRSGSGKSTLLHILGCIDRPTAGFFSFEGIDVLKATKNELTELRNSKIGFILQEFGLILDQTALENISVPLLFSKIKYNQINKKVMETMDSLNIADLAKRKVNQLSGGQKQRVAIARAIVNNPEIILADEPTGALDINTSNEIMNVLLQLNKTGKTIIIVTHDMQIASKCNKSVKISDGVLTVNNNE